MEEANKIYNGIEFANMPKEGSRALLIVENMNTCPFFTASNLKKVPHGFFSNGGAFTLAKGEPFVSCNVAFGRGDSDDVVAINRQRVADSIGHPVRKVVFTKQEHTNEVVVVDENTTITSPCDALVTTTPGILIGIYTADCVPVLLFGGSVVGVVHCGWKGLKLKIIQNTLNAMLALGAKDLAAAIGPSIGKKNYVVDENFLNEFPEDLDCMEKQDNGWHADLRKIAAKQLAIVQNIEEICLDTYDFPNVFFSCRRFLPANEPVRTQASVIML
ncbi:MAG: peptidoglycan editing factor PgeF [Holosporales bacterium]|jgi:YfiH family protein|nr:peptidoglycan editing factor PgeF [Holosporales bacterium]